MITLKCKAMDEYEDLDAYNGNVEHDMWVDYDYHQNTDELPECFDEEYEADGDY